MYLKHQEFWFIELFYLESSVYPQLKCEGKWKLYLENFAADTL